MGAHQIDGECFDISGAASDRTSSTVLVVDDHAAVRDFVKCLLQKHDYSVLTAGDAEAAVDLLSAYRGRIQLVLSDIEMPGMGGEALADVIGRQYPDIRVMLMTGLPLHEVASRWRHAVVSKTFNPEQLLKRTERALKALDLDDGIQYPRSA